MRNLLLPFLLLLQALPVIVALASTDSIQDGDLGQTGYVPNKNIDPKVVNSAAFKVLWQKTFNTNELHYALPLLYTPPSTGKQIVFLASSQNYIRTFDAVTGTLLNSRQVQVPYSAADINCSDTPYGVGIQGTPIIDPNTDTVYFFSKSYIPNYRASGNTGVLNGVYYFYGVNINTLDTVSGYPILLDKTVAQNDNLQYFIGGLSFQHTALTIVQNVVFGGFASHCDYNNYTGMVFGISTSAKKIVANFAMESGSAINHKAWNVNGGGGQAGVWMSGMAPATDGNRFFIVSGNGLNGANGANPAKGNSGLQTLEEAVVDFAVSQSGAISVTDYFEPTNYKSLDSSDSDLGSGGIVLLDKSTFFGTGISQLGVVVGKTGLVYVLDANNLGGYKEGAGQTDAVVTTMNLASGVWGGCGSYPGEGGYLYCAPQGKPVVAFKFSRSSSGAPVFTQVATTSASSVFGVGQPTISSLNGAAGSAIVWLTDPSAGLLAWAAVPGSNGLLTPLTIPTLNGMNKYQRPVFGDGRVYVTDKAGTLYALGNSGTSPPATSTKGTTTSSTSKAAASSSAPPSGGGTLPKWSQCAGMGWTGSGTCVAGTTCMYSNPYYSQCL